MIKIFCLFLFLQNKNNLKNNYLKITKIKNMNIYSKEITYKYNIKNYNKNYSITIKDLCNLS